MQDARFVSFDQFDKHIDEWFSNRNVWFCFFLLSQHFPYLSYKSKKAKMEAEGIAPSAISAFESTFKSLVSGNTGIIPESTISPAADLVASESFTHQPDASLLSETVVLKLNGGLGTGMGLDKAKSLLTVKGNDTFLDLTAKQIIGMRKEFGMKVKFMLMNSFSTSEDTMAFLEEKYPGLAGEDGLEMMQNKVPKLDEKTFEVSRRKWNVTPFELIL